MQHHYDFSWHDAGVTALRSFESQSSMYLNPQPQLPITLPQSTYDPTFSTPSFFGYPLSDPRPVNADIHNAYGSGRIATGQYDNGGHDRQSQQALWDGFNLDNEISSHQQGRAGYAGPSVYQEQDATFQVIRMPSRNVLPLVPIYDNTAADSLLQADLLQSSNPNLYPQNAMPLTIKHPEFRQQGQAQQSTPNDNAWTQSIMNNVVRLEHASNAQGSSGSYQPPLTVSQAHSQAQQHMQSQQQTQSYASQQQQQQQQQQEEQIAMLHAFLAQSQEAHMPNDVTQLYQQTANLHDDIAASRLNSGAKEIATLPSAIPSVPSLLVRTPAPIQRFVQNHPYTSPRFAPHATLSPRLGVGGLTGGSLRSLRPSVPRIKRESLSIPAPTTTAYLAGLRRQIPLFELASERTPVEPYPRTQQQQQQQGHLMYPLSLASGSSSGSGSGMGMGMGNAMPGSASTSTSSLPSESPFARTHSMLPNLTIPETRPQPGSVSPQKEYSAVTNDGGFLRFYRGNVQERPGTGTTVASSSTAVSQGTTQQGQGQGQGAERLQSPILQSQTRATAARKRADDDILQHSFRNDTDWRRRAVLEAVLASSFVAENTLEPLSTGTGAGTPGDNTLIMGIGVGEDMGMGLGAPGKSIYAVFLEQVEKSEWRCLFGDRDHPCPSQAVAFRRLERALDHVRSHLNHRPFGCKGECQKGESCDARFFARSHLQDHVKRTESACCDTCGQVIRIQNMPRHRMAH